MIQSFACAETAALWEGARVRRLPPDIQRTALRKLAQLHAVLELKHLAVPPGNRLEALRGNWAGFHSVLINDQRRLCFRWEEDGPHEVQILDYQ